MAAAACCWCSFLRTDTFSTADKSAGSNERQTLLFYRRAITIAARASHDSNLRLLYLLNHCFCCFWTLLSGVVSTVSNSKRSWEQQPDGGCRSFILLEP